MKFKFFSVFLGAALLASQAKANEEVSVEDLSAQVAQSLAEAVGTGYRIFNRLNWQVGEFHNIDVKLSFLSGSGQKVVSQDVPSEGAFWYVTTMTLAGQQQKTEALIRRADGKVLKLIVNGKEQDPNGNDGSELEILDQYETTVTVPAGTFECLYVKAKTVAQGQEQILEAWVNPIKVNLDGTLKLVVQTQFGPLTMSLKQFGKK